MRNDLQAICHRAAILMTVLFSRFCLQHPLKYKSKCYSIDEIRRFISTFFSKNLCEMKVLKGIQPQKKNEEKIFFSLNNTISFLQQLRGW